MSVVSDLTAVLERDQGLPGHYFTDESVFDLERRSLFAKSWICIGVSDDVPDKGSLYPVTALGLPLLVVRDEAGLNVFHNVCSHRGAILVEAPVLRGPRIVCPYHAWAYRLDGTLATTPHVGGAGVHRCERVEAEKLALKSVRSAEWAGHVFVNLSGDAPAFDNWIKPTRDRFSTVRWDLLRRDASLSATFEVAANWKIICENFVESYHLPSIHRELNSVNPMQSHYQILGGRSYLGQGGTAYEGDSVAGSVLPLLDGLDPKRYDSLNVFPTFIIAPLADMTFSITLFPLSAQRTLERVEFFFAGDEALNERYAQARRAGTDFIGRVNREDIGIVESVQRGRHSPAFSGGQFSQAQEATSLQLQKILAASLLSDLGEPYEAVELPIRDIPHPT